MLRLKHFLIQDDQVIIDKILLGIVKNEKTDYKLTVVKINFSIKNCNTLIKKNAQKLSTTAKDLFHFVQILVNYATKKNSFQFIC